MEIPAFAKAELILKALKAARQPVTLQEISDWISRNTPERLSERQIRRHLGPLIKLDLVERDDTEPPYRFSKKNRPTTGG